MLSYVRLASPALPSVHSFSDAHVMVYSLFLVRLVRMCMHMAINTVIEYRVKERTCKMTTLTPEHVMVGSP